MYAEDLDLGWRLARAGWPTRYEPRARVHHHAGAATSQAWGDAQVDRWMLSTYAWMLRRRGVLRTRIFAALNVVGAAARWGLLAGPAHAHPQRFARSRDEMRTWAGRHWRAGLASRAKLDAHR
jgi:GT2 family glycosyltransferase